MVRRVGLHAPPERNGDRIRNLSDDLCGSIVPPAPASLDGGITSLLQEMHLSVRSRPRCRRA
jgi:hypothetical protein